MHPRSLSRPLSTASTLTLASAACLSALGCQPELPPFAARGPGDPAAEPHAVIEPDAPFDAAPRVLRVRVVPEEGASADPARLLFVRGHVGPAHVRQVQRADVSKALSERVLPAFTWSDDDGSALLAPAFPLEPDVTYGVLSGDPPLGLDVRADAADPVPLLARVWPPSPAAGSPAVSADTAPFAILCDPANLTDDLEAAVTPDLPAPPARLPLSPGDIDAAAATGLAPAMPGPCLRIDIDSPVAPDPSSPPAPDPGSPPSGPGSPSLQALPPPLLQLADDSLVRLDPQPISLSAPLAAAPPTPALACDPPALPFGPGCALVADDRLFLATPDAPLLWAVRPTTAAAPNSISPSPATLVRVTRPEQPFVLRGFTPSSPVSLSLLALDASGHPYTSTFTATTRPPLPHVVLTEVLANPIGVEPDQEWIELYNDGLAPADLSSYAILDIGGETPLPPAVLPPGAYALVVNETFNEDDDLDPAPAPGTLLLRVPKLGKGGLKNDGEPLKLRAPDGAIVSRFPAAPKPKAGHSLTRITPASPDGDPASFTAAPPTPGAPYSLPAP